MQKRIFITGGTGLLGRAILARLQTTDHTITALRRTTSDLSGLPASINWVEGHLLDEPFLEQQIKEADVVIHCAAVVDFRPKLREKMLDVNVNGTIAITNACTEYKKRLIYISSVAALGFKENGKPTTEEDDYQPDVINTDYALSKHLAEMEVWRGIAEGLEAVILNPTIVIGKPAKWHQSTGSFWVSARKNLSFYTTGTVGFVDARDIADVIAELIVSNIQGEGFIMNSENLKYKDFQTQVALSINAKPPTKPIGPALGGLFWRAGNVIRWVTGKQIPYTKAIHHVASKDVYYSNKKAINELNASFRPVSESIEWLSAQFLVDEQQ